MDVVLQPNVHATIVKGPALPAPQRCSTCCPTGLYHCPFCSPLSYKPTKRSKLKHHLEVHRRRACRIGEYVVYRCGHGCRRNLHFHCLYCPATVMRRRDFIIHVPFCREMQEKRMSKQGDQEEFPQTNSHSLFIDSSNNSDSDEMANLTDSQDEESSSRSVTHFVYRSNDCDVTGSMKTEEPNSSKCDQMVQTDAEKPRDCDEYYFMNLVKVFKRLIPQKQAEVRIKMERILFEAELG
ncbi:uncharacterized protein LOC133419963 [Cololabis saira]|uniref:uncharacterized protein LOC133419963 n=1 Tax=Cololabis saira TaxID=129043 RepID=UPI002AD2A110|nr:uncharacterized protein LOC133419963 [Cololabis saira]